MSLLQHHDALFFDLDGTVWEGGRALPMAVEAFEKNTLPVAFITNNASRGPSAVAEMLSLIGIEADPEDVVTSAQAAIDLAAEHLQPGDIVYVLGTDSFKELARNAGYTVALSAEEKPRAVFHGHNPKTGWAELSEAAMSIRNGARYFVSNLDSTLPTERGLCVGNGSMVAAIAHATGARPVFAGKPEAAMFNTAAQRLGVSKPLAIGDRLNTDIAGGVAADIATLHVMTGVSKHWDLLRAIASERPTYLGLDLSDLFEEPQKLVPGEQGDFRAVWRGNDIELSGGASTSTHMEALRTVAAIAWEHDAWNGELLTRGEHAGRVLLEWE
ncbi:HAD-IIA family hydrolase [Corynebacterium pseudotuberculosis]|uniref:HAD-IIA family hydrolase n=1 Tax=Corynebacterium pseudotuberculosis TaxID=1719 RepID=UPI0007DB03A5|nr:HAD-IIA family hydrolase [Corynebacterium pseudotuberculosis]ANH25724.1 Haloacid dehalogenase (HAD) superfamily hydrolase [Corynebacterium pseudotuberculosis]QGX59016.1 HAD-IIA family hydrolase [Corynebacterium pseudotuberculosis]